VMPHPQRLLFYQKRRSLSTRKFKSFRETKKQGQWGRGNTPAGSLRGAQRRGNPFPVPRGVIARSEATWQSVTPVLTRSQIRQRPRRGTDSHTSLRTGSE
jgi:hypothetical protein